MSVLDIVRANFSRRSDIQGELRLIDESATTDKRDYSEEESTKITELRSELETIDERIQANLAQEIRATEIQNGLDRFLGVIADQNSGEVEDTRSIGERFVGTDAYQAFSKAGGNGNQYPMETFDGLEARAVTNVTLGSTSGGAFVRPQRLTRVGQTFLQRRVFLTDFLPSIPITQGVFEYVQDQSPLADLADKPAETAEGTAKPQAGITMGVVQEKIGTIPAWVNLTRQVAADAPQVQGYLDQYLRYALKRRYDKQVINGDGTGQNLQGLAQRSNVVTYAPSSAEARYRSIRHAVRLLEDVEAVPELIVLAPADAELFDLSNDTTAGLHAVNALTDEVDAVGAAAAGNPRTAWGMQQIRSTALANGTALLIDPMAVLLGDRQQPTAYMTDSHASNFTSNILTLLLEMRAGLGLLQPGVAVVTFNGTA